MYPYYTKRIRITWYVLALALFVCQVTDLPHSYSLSAVENNLSPMSRDVDILGFTPVTDRVKTLELIARSSESNYSKIKTWKANYSFEHRILYSDVYRKESKIDLPEGGLIIVRGNFAFSFQANPKTFFVDYQPV